MRYLDVMGPGSDDNVTESFHGCTMSLVDIGNIIGLTRERVRQIVGEAFLKIMRKHGDLIGTTIGE